MPRGRQKPTPLPDDIPSEHPALTPEARENRVIALAYDLAEQRIRAGTASAAEVTYFLRLGSQKERLEQELLSERTRLATAKAEAIDRGRDEEERYARVLEAIRSYSGAFQPSDKDDGGY